MVSRMDRYYDKPRVPRARSSRNESLYKKIQDLDTYSNIEAVESIAKTNEIDLSKVKEMIKNRENFKKQREYRSAFNIEEEQNSVSSNDKFLDEEKNYDIMDVLNKAKDNYEEDSSNRNLKNMHYDVINDLNLRKDNYEDSEEELKSLISTITSMKEDSEDGGLLDDLTSDTMVGEASSIHKILEDEKKQQKKLDSTSEMDKSFFTSAMSFTDKDFEELKDMGHRVKKNNLLLIIMIIIILLAIAGVVVFLIVRG